MPSAENDVPPCICTPVPRLATLDGRDGWKLTNDDCRWHGRNHFGNRPIPPGGGE